MKLIVVAEDAVTDKERNNVSIFNVRDSILTPGFPLIFPRLVVVAFTERDLESDPDDVDLRLRISVAGGKKLGEVTTGISYQDKKRNRLIVRVDGLVVNEPGLVHFAIYHGRSRLGRYSIDVAHLDKPQLKAESGAAKKKGRKKAKKTR
ncbi:MAG: hypothetical protein IH830_03885 [Planctomycetes bacterium]|nr:hypothetical protein [Planctomycetota bacterium]